MLTPDKLHDRLTHLLTFHSETGEFTRRVSIKGYSAGSPIGTLNDKGYLVAYIDSKQYRVHQLVWFLHHGEFLKEIDHIDRNRSNNRLINLRPCLRLENCGNTSPRVHKYKGVTFCKTTQKWKAQIGIDYRNVNLGRFQTIEEAALVYNNAAVEHFGEFAYVNQIEYHENT